MTRMLIDMSQTNDTKTEARLDAEMHLAPIEDIVGDIAAGKMVVSSTMNIERMRAISLWLLKPSLPKQLTS